MIRRLLGAIGLGLPAAVLAHAILYSNDHAMGGSHRELFSLFASTTVLGFAAFWIVLSLIGRGRICQGRVLNAAINQLLPSAESLFAATFGWFWLAESIESGHGSAPAFWILTALLGSSALLKLVVRASLRALAKIVFAADSGDFKSRSYRCVSIARQPLATAPAVQVLRLFSRPPPNQHSY